MKRLVLMIVLVLALVPLWAEDFSFSGLVDKVLDIYEGYSQEVEEPFTYNSFYGTYVFTKESYPYLKNIVEMEAAKSSAVASFFAEIPLIDLTFSSVTIEVEFQEEGNLVLYADIPFIPKGTYQENIPFEVVSPTELLVTLNNEFSGNYRDRIGFILFPEDFQSVWLMELGDNEETLRLFRP